MFRKILIIVDDHPSAQAAIRHGVELADERGSEVVFFYLLPQFPYPLSDMAGVATMSPEEFERASKEAATKVLKAATRFAEGAAVVSLSVMSAGIDAANSAVEAATKRHCNLIVVASEGQNAVMRLLTGSVIPRLITLSPLPVLVCPTTDPSGYRKRRAPARDQIERAGVSPRSSNDAAVRHR